MIRIALAVALLLAGAGPCLADDPVITITLKDHQFTPGEVPVPAGVKVQLVIKNEQTTTAEFESKSLHREKVIPAGGQVTLYVGPLPAGSYDFFDDFYAAARGKLVVK